MINEKQLKKELEKKQKELQKIKSEYARIQYQKHVDAFLQVFATSDGFVRMIHDTCMSREDMRVFASSICNNLYTLYNKIEPDIIKYREKRAQKNKARNERRTVNMSQSVTHTDDRTY